MSQPLDGAALQQAGAVLRRLAAHVEDGSLADTDGTAPAVAAAWRGASEALGQTANAGSPVVNRKRDDLADRRT